MMVFLVSCTVIVCWTSVVSAQEAAEAKSSGEFLQRTFEGEGMPLLTGPVWQERARMKRLLLFGAQVML